jgi:hypothetical protein
LLFVAPQGSPLFDGDGDGDVFDDGVADVFGEGVADAFGVGAAWMESELLAIASAASGTSTMRFTCECSPWERPARPDVRALGIIVFPNV